MMMDLVISSYVRAGLRLRAFGSTLSTRRERGADALEYIGMVILASLIIGGIFTVAKGLDLQAQFEEAANKILGKG